MSSLCIGGDRTECAALEAMRFQADVTIPHQATRVCRAVVELAHLGAMRVGSVLEASIPVAAFLHSMVVAS